MNLYKLLLVGGGGFFGSIARYITSRSIDSKLNAVFPYGTFVVNILGAFLLGLIYSWVARRPGDGENFRLLLITGFCGGFTTFSAFAFENVSLLQQKNVMHAAGYVVLSVILSVGAVFAGITLGKTIQ